MTASPFIWEWGTAYDFFISQSVLYQPADFGLRAAWAAGIRSRLPPTERDILELALTFIKDPLTWIQTLPEPKDSDAVLWALRQIPPSERWLTLMQSPKVPPEMVTLVQRVIAQKSWDEADLESLVTLCTAWGKSPAKKARVRFLDWHTRAEELGERYLAALRTYQEVFFKEEEKRITPYLQQALERAQSLAEQLPLMDLLAELSQGVRLDAVAEVSEWVFVPSFWLTPFIMYTKLSAARMLFVFGARPANASLVPGEIVPDALVQALKALSNPTRLRILHYLTGDTLTSAQLARRLRLRAPTVTHHLHALRLAGLVYLTVQEGKEQYYTARSEAIASVFDVLKEFLMS